VTAAPPKVGGRSIVTESEVDLAAPEFNQRPASLPSSPASSGSREKAAVAADLREVYAEVKGDGFDVKALRAVVRHPQAA